MKRTVTLAAGALAIILVGCGGSPATPSSAIVADAVPSSAPTVTAVPTARPTPTATPTPLPPPTPAPDPEAVRKTAGAAYLAAVAPYNKTIKTLWRQYRHKTSLSANKAYCSKLAANEHTWLLAMQKIVVPADTTADARALIRFAAGAEAHLRACAKAGTSASWLRSWNLARKANDRSFEAANLVRLDLGIAPIPG